MRVPIAIANFGGQGAEQLEREQHVAMVSIARRDGSTLRSRRVSHSRRQLEMPRIASSQTGRIENVRLGRRFSCEPGFEQDVSPGGVDNNERESARRSYGARARGSRAR